MQALTLTARQGWSWLGGGFAIFRRNPALLALLVMAYWMIVGVLNMVPVLGSIAATIAIPAFSAGLMQACRDIERTGATGFETLFAGFRQHPRTLLILGVLYLLATLGILAASAVADDGQLLHWMLTGKAPPGLGSPDASANAPFLAAMQIALLLLVPVLMAWWYAPVLAAWHGHTAGKSLFFSFVACWRNWRAFLGYAAAVLLYTAILPGTLLAVLITVTPISPDFLTTLFSVPLLFVLAPTLVGSFYVSYRDVFVIDERA